MKLRKDILLRSLTEAAIEQVASDYQEAGYEVAREARLGDLMTDLMAKKGDELIVFEFKPGEWNEAKRQAVRRLRNYVVHRLGAQFRLILVNPPGEVSIEVEGLEEALVELLYEYCASELSELATHTYIDHISDIEFDKVVVRKDEIELLGSAIASLTLQYGSNGDLRRGDGLRSAESFSFTFHVLLDQDLEVKDILSFDLDTSDYWD